MDLSLPPLARRGEAPDTFTGWGGNPLKAAHWKGCDMQPDWKKESDYRFPKNTSLDRWAAEFLWRNPKFQKEVEAALNEPDLPPPPAGCPPIGWNKKPLGKVLKKWGVSTPMLPQWVEQGLSDSQFIFEKFPRYVFSHKVTTAGGLFTDKAIGLRYCVALESSEKSVLEFDLTAPINPQIERAKKMLTAQQKQNNQGKQIVKKAIAPLYPWYLRTLDALAAGVGRSQVVELFSAQCSEAISDDLLRKWEMEAKRLRNGGYRDLVTAPLPPSK